MLTPQQAATELGVCVQTVYALCAACQLRHSRIGLGRGRIAIAEEAVADYLRRREVGPQQAEPTPSCRLNLKLNHLRVK